MAEMETVSEPRICDVGGHVYNGLLLPLFGDWEAEWPQALKVVLYLIGLLWCFQGVSIIAEVFMNAIEKVTAAKRQVMNKKTGHKVTVKVWNDTVANLTLMALGSSAPEILLNVIELLGAGMYSGALGASTIVGSAAFNLLVISAVCVAAIPDGEIRKIKDLQVFSITAVFSVFAYLWLLVILIGITKDMVDPWEGIVTFLYFPLLVVVAYFADIGMFGKSTARNTKTLWSEVTKEQVAEMMMQIRMEHGANLSNQEVVALLQYQYTESKSRAAYRVAASRKMSGGKKVKGISDRETQAGLIVARRASMFTPEGKAKPTVLVEFAAEKYTVLENVGQCRLHVDRTGEISMESKVSYKTRSGSATAGKDFKAKEDSIVFKPGETSKNIDIEIINDDEYEDTEEFYVDLVSHTTSDSSIYAGFGAEKTTTVVIVDDDLPGVLSFKQDEVRVQETTSTYEAKITVVRNHGGSGSIACRYRSEDDTAKAGGDYEQVEGTLEFDGGQMESSFTVQIKPKGRFESTEKFRLIIDEASGGATFDPDTDGGEESCICTVWIEADFEARGQVEKVMASISPDWDAVALGNTQWKDQFLEAIYCGGSPEAQQESSKFEVVLHGITLPWKLLFAAVPPTEYCGGWLCFFSALIMIGAVTVVIGDLASLLGCALNIPDSLTAISLVALGTSLPDTFASKTAAQQDPYADASIGNVTGSNSVNVFLGIGLPWMIGAIYWKLEGPTQEWKNRYPALSIPYPDGGFIVDSNGLGFSVSVFCGCAVACFAVLVGRRVMFGGELGGPKNPKYISCAILVFLWVLYLGLSAWYDLTQKS
eukprot:TRINITY_DN39137_c0_g1_i1.p1 TRINITY_DN39137_c0_g1~~TRINITY_DN39137_c0_g1_i1.p1  ORF type:complete len:821 (+),score=131.44 TRINITY_DN39137_c0_g1_i1:95-2557(+)